MSSYYYRDKSGNWFVRHGDKLDLVEFVIGASMECAYLMGQMSILEKQREELNETTM